MDMIKVKIDGREYSVPAGSTVLEACRYAGIDIPTLCYLKDVNEIGACRLCLVEVKGARGLVTACVYPTEAPRIDKETGAEIPMEIFTNTAKVKAARKTNIELVLSAHEKKCLSCIRSTTCELQKLAKDFGADAERFNNRYPDKPIDTSTPFLVRDNNKCILCRRCIGACNNQSIGAITAVNRGFDTLVAPAFDKDLFETSCIGCGQCVVACPTGALYEHDDTGRVFAALADPDKHVVICTAPSVRATIGECFGYEPGTDVEGKMVAAIKRLGFAGVFDMNFTADLTIIEEAHELIERIQNGGKLPLITSCSPGWIKFCEHYFPEFTDNLSTCKSPQQMFGALYKTYIAKKLGLDPAKIFFVSAIPCTAKKFEVTRDHQDVEGVPGVDVAITTRELGRMIESAGINFRGLEDEPFDQPFDIGSSAGAIFGATGGVMEAALRTAAETILGTELEKVEFEDVRGTAPIKRATYKLGELEVKVAVASGTANARQLLNAIKEGKEDYHFIEIMACPGGCVNGGGQPIQDATVRSTVDLKAKRAAVLYNDDANCELRKSHDNPLIKKVYEEFLGEPGSHLAHEILHTSYVKRGI
jgi:NADP-reducing hydrogenase subunit HndD